LSAEKIRVASAQYTLEPNREWSALADKLDSWVGEAARAGARLLVFPEYGSLELFRLVDRRVKERRSPERHLLGPLPIASSDRRKTESLLYITEAIQPLVPRYLAHHAALAARHRVYILAGSLPLQHEDGSLTNTAYFFAPDGTMSSQEKIVLTRWEKEVWGMRGGSEVRVFETDFGRIAIDICYDIEFPIVARRQAEGRAQIILAPCCCDSQRGYHRVRIGAKARALENQAYVIQSPLMGTMDWLPSIGRCVGQAGIFGPPDLGPHVNGVLSQGPADIAGWTYADLDLVAIDRIRGSRGIANADEWNAHLDLGPAVTGAFREVA
jgi:predicted amidohydrolase